MLRKVGREPLKVRYEVDLANIVQPNRHEWRGVSPPTLVEWGVQSFCARQKFTRQNGGLIYVVMINVLRRRVLVDRFQHRVSLPRIFLRDAQVIQMQAILAIL